MVVITGVIKGADVGVEIETIVVEVETVLVVEGDGVAVVVGDVLW